LPKEMPKIILFPFFKVEKHTILAGQGGGGKCPLLPSPADAHGRQVQGALKCRLMNEYPFFLFKIGHWYF